MSPDREPLTGPLRPIPARRKKETPAAYLVRLVAYFKAQKLPAGMALAAARRIIAASA